MMMQKNKGYTTTADARKHLSKMRKEQDDRMVKTLLSNRKDEVKRTELELVELKKSLVEDKKLAAEASAKAKGKDTSPELVAAAEAKADEVEALQEKIFNAEVRVKQAKADIKRLAGDKTDG
jgi:hypothetical protein